MTAILDTSFLFALSDQGDRNHQRVLAVAQSVNEPLVLPVVVLPIAPPYPSLTISSNYSSIIQIAGKYSSQTWIDDYAGKNTLGNQQLNCDRLRNITSSTIKKEQGS
ncbi:hypothetical protein [Calothrix sp. 336/3]|uniref:hypothetical protein n=1 Tax=Calothrix sp. 336/3 TaxID=1337936 RepID=UPI000A8C0232|nr:hypothetical protein [Calothrix sp. 336/3]